MVSAIEGTMARSALCNLGGGECGLARPGLRTSAQRRPGLRTIDDGKARGKYLAAGFREILTGCRPRC